MAATLTLEDLQRRVPVVGDKALIDLVNGIQVNRDIIRYRKNRGFFGQLLDTLAGSDRQRQLLLDGNLLAGQDALHQWVLELTDVLQVSQVALQITQQSLLETRTAIRSQRQDLAELSQHLTRLAQAVEARLSELDSRVHRLEKRVAANELRAAANEDLDRIFTAWSAQQTYIGFPWLLQVVFLIRELCSSSILLYELESGDSMQFRDRFINKILAESKHIPDRFFSLTDLLDETWRSTSSTDRNLATGLLETCSLSRQRLQNIPYLYTIGTTFELAALPESARPTKPAECAIELCRTQIESIPFGTDKKELITLIVEETAQDYLAIMTRSVRS